MTRREPSDGGATRQRLLLLALAASAVQPGLWALLPRAFHQEFPGGGLRWVAPLGAYDEHLVRDVGAAFLALAVLSLLAARRLEPALVQATALAWTTFQVPHVLSHVHLDTDPLQLVVLLGQLALAIALFVPAHADGPAPVGGTGPSGRA